MIAGRILLMEIGFEKIDGDGIIYLDILPSMYILLYYSVTETLSCLNTVIQSKQTEETPESRIVGLVENNCLAPRLKRFKVVDKTLSCRRRFYSCIINSYIKYI